MENVCSQGRRAITTHIHTHTLEPGTNHGGIMASPVNIPLHLPDAVAIMVPITPPPFLPFLFYPSPARPPYIVEHLCCLCERREVSSGCRSAARANLFHLASRSPVGDKDFEVISGEMSFKKRSRCSQTPHPSIHCHPAVGLYASDIFQLSNHFM